MNNELAIRATSFQLRATDSAISNTSLSYRIADPAIGYFELLNSAMLILVLVSIVCIIVMVIRKKDWRFVGKLLLVSTGSYILGLILALILSYLLSKFFVPSSHVSYSGGYRIFTPNWVTFFMLASFIFMPFVSALLFLKKFFVSFSKVHLFCAATLPYSYLFILFNWLLDFVFY